MHLFLAALNLQPGPQPRARASAAMQRLVLIGLLALHAAGESEGDGVKQNPIGAVIGLMHGLAEKVSINLLSIFPKQASACRGSHRRNCW